MKHAEFIKCLKIKRIIKLIDVLGPKCDNVQNDIQAVWMNPGVTLDMIDDIQRLGIDLCYMRISWNKNITTDFVIEHASEPMAWTWLGCTHEPLLGKADGQHSSHNLDVNKMLEYSKLCERDVPWLQLRHLLELQ